MSTGMPHGQSGLAGERTGLAWRRTALAVAGVALLAARLAAQRDSGLLVAAAVAGWVAFLPLTRRSSRRVLAGDAAAGRAPAWCALALVGYAGLGIVTIIW